MIEEDLQEIEDMIDGRFSLSDEEILEWLKKDVLKLITWIRQTKKDIQIQMGKKTSTMYAYIKTEANCYVVGFYNPQGEWCPESDYSTPAEAANQVSWLNGNHPK